MYFSKMLAGAFLASTAAASLTAVEIAANINILTKKSQDLYGTAQGIDVSTSAAVSASTGAIVAVVDGYTDIVNTATVTVSLLEGSASITAEAEAKIVIDAFADFTASNKDLIDIIIGKTNGVHAEVDASISHSVSTTLRGFDDVVGEITIGLVDIVEVHTGEIKADAKILGQSLSVCINQLEIVAL